MNSYIFRDLYEKSSADGVIIRDATKARWLKKESEQDSDFMSQSDVEPLVLSRQLRAALIVYQSKSVFVTSGFPEQVTMPTGLQAALLTPGMLAVAVTELEIPPSATGAQIRDAIEDLHSDVPEYDGHELIAIEPLFPKMSCFEVDSSHLYGKSLSRLIGSHLSRSYVDGPLLLNDELRSSLVALFETGSKHVPFDLILRGLLSFSWSGFFIELYRCIEQLYAVPKLTELTTAWASSLSLHDTAELIERTLGWRPKEDEALFRLLQTGCTIATLNTAAQALKVEVTSDHTRAAEITARAIYKARNSHVHFRPSKGTASYNDKEWSRIIQSMLLVVGELYLKFGRSFVTPPSDVAHI